MRFTFSVLCAVSVFIGLTAIIIDFSTWYLGRPWRGVSYGISIFYLTAFVAVSGSTALISSRYFGLVIPLISGIFTISSGIILFLPQPGILDRVVIALTVSIVLAAAMLALCKVNRNRHPS